MRRLSTTKNPTKKILFLGYDETQTKIIKVLIDNTCTLDHTADKINGQGGYDFVVSYGYRHILKLDVIEAFDCPIFNLHISYLPYNRGADPNFWSFYDDTPAGVTLHLIDGGIDTGAIVAQRYVNFSEQDDTFAKTYEALLAEAENLFLDNLESLLSDQWKATEQKGEGSHHYKKDLPSNFSGWDSNIKQEIARLKNEGLKYE